MHYMGKTFYAEILFYFYSSDLADLSNIVSSQVYQHIVFCQLFLIFQKSLFNFRGSTCQFNVITGEIKHIRRRIRCPKNPVSIKQASCCFRTHGIGKYYLENITFSDVMFGFLHHLCIFFFRKFRLYFWLKSQRFKFHMLPVSDQLRHFLQFLYCFLVGGFQIICHHTCNQKYFLSEKVKYDHLIKKH